MTGSWLMSYSRFDNFLIIGILIIGICFVLRASDFGFNPLKHSLKPGCNNGGD